MNAKPTRKKPARKTAPPPTKVLPPPPTVGQRYAGVKDGEPTHYLVAGMGKGADPLVAFFITNRNPSAGVTRFATTIIRWSLFCTVYKARQFPLAESVRSKLDVARHRRGAVVGSRTGR